MTSLCLKNLPFHRGLISNIYIVIYNTSKISYEAATKLILWLGERGHHNMGNCIQRCQHRKVEKPYCSNWLHSYRYNLELLLLPPQC